MSTMRNVVVDTCVLEVKVKQNSLENGRSLFGPALQRNFEKLAFKFLVVKFLIKNDLYRR